MKKLIITSILTVLISSGTMIMAQRQQDDYLGLPGDNLNLYAVMDLFQKSETLESFERSLNEENSKINNIDLNGDNYVDYIRVVDYVDGNVHNIVLQVPLNPRENQDVAVFTVQRFNDGSVQIQLIGDEALYGSNYIIEPIFDETPNPGYTGGANNVVRTTTVQISAWPLVRLIFLPNYTVWHSSWYYDYYPTYWHPWRPYYYHYYYGYHYHWYPSYYERYRRWDHHRYSRWDDFYYREKRAHSAFVNDRIRSGRYKETYSHPEQRSVGEASFREANQNQQNGRRSVSTASSARSSTKAGTNATRRSSTSVANSRSGSAPTSRQGTGTNTRRSTNVNKSTGTNPSSGRKSGTKNSTTTTVNNRSGANPSSGQNSGTVRRSGRTVSSSSTSNPSSGQKSGTVKSSGRTISSSSGSNSSGQKSSTVRSSGTNVNRSSNTNPSSGQSTQTSRSSRQSSSTVSSSNRRSSGSSGTSKSGTSAKKETKSQKSESTKTNRRGN